MTPNLPIFVVLHALAVEDGELTVGEELVINANHISGMFPAEAREEKGKAIPCTMIAAVGLQEPVHVVESVQDVFDLVMRVVSPQPEAPVQQELLFTGIENPWNKE